MKFKIKILLVVCILILAAACEENLTNPPKVQGVRMIPTVTVTAGVEVNKTLAAPTISSTEFVSSPTAPTVALDWKNLSIIPEKISQRTIEIYRNGQELHNNPYAFSVMGDCDSSPSWFLGDFDRGPSFYSLGKYIELTLVIDAFHGSFERKSLAVRSGFNTASILSPIWADPESCQVGEAPLDCEIRLHHPAFIFILLGTNDSYNLETFETNMRTILDNLIQNGIVPILATKADNLEGQYQINAIIARLAGEYDVPLWNFWRALQSLPDQGLQPDGAHLTWSRNYFDDPKAMQNAWPWRNLTALQVLDFVWRSVQAAN
jgi:hypothetical protein